MADGELAGIGVLVTRPEDQAARMIAAIEAAGGSAIHFPALQIVPRDSAKVAADAAALSAPDITLFVSANAVRFGLACAGEAKIGAVGPATAAALEAAGKQVDIRPASGFDSESLLREASLQAIEGKTVRIVRGNAGRELIASTLRRRGASVDYLPVYRRQAPAVDRKARAALERRWRGGEIDVVTIMSVATLHNLLSLLSPPCLDALRASVLVTPAARVVKEAHNLLPGIRTRLADGPQAMHMVRAIAEHAAGHSQ